MAVYKNEELKRHSKLLQHFFNEDVTLETQAVYALQSFVHSLQHPPNVLQQIFDTCYDEDVISEAAFRAWYDATDREEDVISEAAFRAWYDATDREEDGKGVAKLSVVNFFKWLDEADDEADDENAK
jgi:translation initiation factor 4G